jgi:hypothetical protein
MSAGANGTGGPPETLHLWGAPAAGKTGVLGALYATSKSREPDRWEAHPKDCRDAYTQEQLLDAYEQLLDRALVKTDVRKDGYRPLDFLLRQYRRGAPSGDTLRLSIVDPAGEYSVRTELGHTEHGRSLFARVAHGGGLLWLFSAAPDAGPATLDRLVVLRHLVALLEHAGGPQLGLPVGLCLSKVDALPPDRREAALTDPRAALLAHLGPTAFTWFEAACPRLRCFAISSAGTEPGYVRPVGLLPMLSWFAGEIGGVRATPPSDAAAVSRPVPPTAPTPEPSAPDLTATMEVPALRPTGRGGLAALAGRLATAGSVPAGDTPTGDAQPVRDVRAAAAAGDVTIYDLPAVSRPPTVPVAAATLAVPAASWPAPPAPREMEAEPAPPSSAQARDAAPSESGRPGDVPFDVRPHQDHPAEWRQDGGVLHASWRARAVRAAASGGLVLAALGAGAWVGRAAVRAAAVRWQPPDAPSAMPAIGRAIALPPNGTLDRDPLLELRLEAMRARDRAVLDEPPAWLDEDPDANEATAAAPEREPDRELRFDTITVPLPRTPRPPRSDRDASPDDAA